MGRHFKVCHIMKLDVELLVLTFNGSIYHYYFYMGVTSLKLAIRSSLCRSSPESQTTGSLF